MRSHDSLLSRVSGIEETVRQAVQAVHASLEERRAASPSGSVRQKRGGRAAAARRNLHNNGADGTAIESGATVGSDTAVNRAATNGAAAHAEGAELHDEGAVSGVASCSSSFNTASFNA